MPAPLGLLLWDLFPEVKTLVPRKNRTSTAGAQCCPDVQKNNSTFQSHERHPVFFPTGLRTGFYKFLLCAPNFTGQLSCLNSPIFGVEAAKHSTPQGIIWASYEMTLLYYQQSESLPLKSFPGLCIPLTTHSFFFLINFNKFLLVGTCFSLTLPFTTILLFIFGGESTPLH